MATEPASSSQPPAAPPRFGIGSIVRHLQFGVGRIVCDEPGHYVIVFKGGDTRRVAFSYDVLEIEEHKGDPDADRVRQAVRDILGDHGWIDVDLELAPRWTGGVMRLQPG